ncbi:hypothetical protein L218DRAFT_214962 [Marasmius fiardii PR-910]|nr:hypothetical protein L218DRAFT_214962 [Marasmius fiardii PR-910]
MDKLGRHMLVSLVSICGLLSCGRIRSSGVVNSRDGLLCYVLSYFFVTFGTSREIRNYRAAFPTWRRWLKFERRKVVKETQSTELSFPEEKKLSHDSIIVDIRPPSPAFSFEVDLGRASPSENSRSSLMNISPRDLRIHALPVTDTRTNIRVLPPPPHPGSPVLS